MKKINLLKPDVVTGYLSDGKGQEITYLNIDPKLTLSMLKEDIRNGAIHLKEVAGVAVKNNRVVVINCRSREEGLNAVSYLASIYNSREGADEEDNDDDEYSVSTESRIEFEDFGSPYDEEVVNWPTSPSSDEEDDDWERGDTWEENPWRIPVIDMGKLSADRDDGTNNPFFNNGMGFGRTAEGNGRVPYWRYTRKESLCVVYNVGYAFTYSPFDPEVFKRYRSNRHLFVLIVDPRASLNDGTGHTDEDEENDYVPEWMPTRAYESGVTRFVLESSAELISIHSDERDTDAYYQILFENWVDYYGYTLAKGFPIVRICKRIAGMNNDDRSDMMDKVIRYVTKDHERPGELTDRDFNVLYKLRGLGCTENKDEKEHRSLRKLEKNLIGMDHIKDEITAIVETFRYNQRRKAAGIHVGGYHNVHLMLGAPGTAKTTVARILGEIMAEERLLRSARFISVNGAELKGMFVGHSAPKVKSLFEQYDIIFIDEAYAIAAGVDGESDSFSQEAVSQLIIELEDHGLDRLVIFAGYGGSKVSEKDNKMLNFLKCNPGIRSRINSTLFFDSYDAGQMVDIFRGQARMNQYTVSKAADRYVREFFEGRVHDNDFGNGREARSLLENATVCAARRLSRIPEKEITRKMLQHLTTDDVKGAITRMRSAAYAQNGVTNGIRIGFDCTGGA